MSVSQVSLNEAGQPFQIKITPVQGFRSEAIRAWASQNLAPGCAVLTDGLACFRCNRRFDMAEMSERIANAVCCCMPCTERDLRVAELLG